MYPEIDKIMDIIASEGVKIVFTSAGNPAKWTDTLHSAGIKVAHVVSSTRFAAKCEEAGVDAIVAEGFEAGGHNGREETTTFCLIPAVKRICTVRSDRCRRHRYRRRHTGRADTGSRRRTNGHTVRTHAGKFRTLLIQGQMPATE